MLLAALHSQNRSRPPVWLMRQAGRYLPSYQRYREKYPLRELFFTPELAAEITLLPVQELGVDAAILFSDITVTALPLGYSLHFSEGPILEKGGVIQGMESLQPIQQAIRLIKPRLKVPLIGFCGGPYTVASYMGGAAELLEPLLQTTLQYVAMQIEAGVDAIQIFDSWANELSEEAFKAYAEKYLQPIVAASSVPVILFMREAYKYIDTLVGMAPKAISFGWEKPLHELRSRVPMAVQGNLNPELLFQPLQEIRKEVQRLLFSMRGDSGFILNLGHGVKPGTPVDAVRCCIDTVKESVVGSDPCTR
ncbi:MAG: hypothetical protein A3D96_04510 [Chlamydiae bacterium RIFCSPHIGHO2_12_FULL_44_59]|nr:MAG: hypothetical protein A2796_04285 [Chlamydiae bacterium RIFCSPHIGHO2_01_FULL_44_39]OGN58322.1 MAG: hypothetical protein A3C42_01035 [Chlamydiae bacterium RIFCSPHIGHO2_02_FULL_45_9]OGN60351.1 MAG: hypothetical protein A3D96_04510 [Chlamydiae bacterium RIFCSPHIGHO2_12_FULL_44_59]OGN66334.1 MAG: hypothetical protein A2978_01955 [Chlamydiae bacterium RIFCSPLOWO2_01_FULL_44_52]OGN69285.1 MAG: hypothetical protein A3I67_00815 [Chlamydiae bacterium RIFCSPLOWO2_02_FULL_45_22]OGN70225.1 MAG: hyp